MYQLWLKTKQGVCGAALIREDVAITAAHVSPRIFWGGGGVDRLCKRVQLHNCRRPAPRDEGIARRRASLAACLAGCRLTLRPAADKQPRLAGASPRTHPAPWPTAAGALSYRTSVPCAVKTPPHAQCRPSTSRSTQLWAGEPGPARHSNLALTG
jgi:hypothetical protein